MQITRPSLLATALLTVALLGCGGKTGGPTTYPVTGVVTQNGQPVAGAVVQFMPTAADSTASAQAQTADDGTFTVEVTFDMGKTTQPGLPAGDYKVTITKMEAPAGAPSLTRPPKNSLPPKYAMVESTPLSAAVKAEGENRFEFPL